jgi:hypothetical protein
LSFKERAMKQWIALFLAITLPSLASDAPWDRLKTVPTGERIWITYSKGDQVRTAKAEMGSSTENSLTVRIRKAELVVPRGDVRKVAVYAGKSRGKGAGIGALIGAGIGAALFGALATDIGNPDVHAGIFVASGIGVVVGIGSLIGLRVGSTKRAILYQSYDPSTNQAAAGRSQQSR